MYLNCIDSRFVSKNGGQLCEARLPATLMRVACPCRWSNRFQGVAAIVAIMKVAILNGAVFSSTVPGIRRVLFQLALDPPGSFVPLFFLAGEFFLAFFESSTRSHSHKVPPP